MMLYTTQPLYFLKIYSTVSQHYKEHQVYCLGERCEVILNIDLLLQDFIETLLDSVARQAGHGELKLKYSLLIFDLLVFS